jgi:hypothetical protein
MKTTVLQLEGYESRQSILDRLARVNTGKILLVWPKRGALDLNEIDLVLISRAASDRALSLALVSHSPQVIDLAQAHQINCFQSIPAAEHSRWGKIERVSKILPLSEQKIVKEPGPFAQPKKVSHLGGRITFWISAILSGLAIIALVVFLLPSTTIILSPTKVEKTVTMQVWGSPKFKTVNINGNIPLVEKSLDVSNSKVFLTSGKVAIPNAFSKAEVVFTNLTDQPLVIPKGTVVLTSEEPVHRFTTDLEIELGSGIDSSASVAVTAVEPGSSSNVSGGAIQQVEGNLGGWVEVTNPEAASGGLDSEAPSPSEDDYSKAREALIDEIKTQSVAQFMSDSDYVVIKDSIAIDKVVSETRSVEVGQPGDQGTLTLTLRLNALGYLPLDLQDLSLQSIKADLLPDELIYASAPIVSDPESFQSDGQGGYRWTNSASILVGNKIDPVQVAQQVAGKKFDAASTLLQTLYQLYKAPEFLPFLSPFQLPWAAFRINVEVK